MTLQISLEEEHMIWANNIDAAAAEHRQIVGRWCVEAAERRIRRHAYDGDALHRH